MNFAAQSFMRTVCCLLLCVLCYNDLRAQPNGGAPYAAYDLHTGVGFPAGLHVGARVRLFPLLSAEAAIGLLPFTPALTAGINLHTAPTLDLDPAFSLLGTYFREEGTKWFSGSLMFGWLSLRKTSLHGTLRGGLSLLYGERPDGTKTFYPAPALEIGVAYGLR